MGKRLDITGQRFGRWYVEGLSDKKDKYGALFWNCICDCGERRKVSGNSLRMKKTLSCGRSCKARAPHYGHRKSSTPLYHVWENILQRITNPNNRSYHRYGGRGIKICEQWKDFRSFAIDMEPSYKPGLWIERVDNDGDYTPENCVWATRQQQSLNKSNIRMLEFNGEKMPLAHWAKRIGIDKTTLRLRLNAGWSIPEALGFEPRNKGAATTLPLFSQEEPGLPAAVE